MPTLTTKALGEVEVEAGELIRFPDGLFGFQEFHEFVMLAESGESPFQWLQSVNDPNLAFVVIDPALFIEDYKPQVAAGDLQSLGTEKVDQCEVFSIVTIPEDHPEKMTANLQGPILVNRKGNVGRQVISHHGKHHVRVPILEHLEGGA